MSDYAGAAWIPTTHHGGPITARWVIVHGTGYSLSQSAADVARDFQTTNPNSTHYAVGRAGDVAQMVAEDTQAWGNGVITGAPGTGGPAAGQHDPWWTGDPNDVTISIEHVNDANNATPLSGTQAHASFALIADICRRRGIPARPADGSGGITGHYSIDPINRARCPGAYPWQGLWDYLDAHSLRVVPRPESMSEFQGYNGDCTQTAHVSCLNQVDPVRWPFTPAELDALTKSDIAHGWADPSGAQTLAGLANSIRNEGLAFTQYTSGLLPVLDTWGGVKPMQLGFSNAQALPGDETGLQGHAIGCMGWDPVHHTGIFCDGDNKSPSHPVTYTLAELQAAQWDSLTVYEYIPAGGHLMASAVGQLGAGFAAYAAAHPELGSLITNGEVDTGDPRYPGEAFACFANGILYYTQAFGVRADRGPWLVLELWQELEKLRSVTGMPEGGA